ncbi:uncharacterized protein E5676_scaffold172G00180 [Cucumis melo var. makuwa]|uniref:DUF4219 domain-containing protein n=1 Tax=Cucumis melo var. makuwa TaxID=1194695 RepID=A0A5D3E785_CUCMM|nr:uncharacterized protein E5676_scaffold172G00180 [Cucumis melo var. makuwa]
MMMGDLQVEGIKKLNTQKYKAWSTCMKSDLQGQDLWNVVGGTKVNPLEDVALKKSNIKARKAMFAIKTTIDEEMLEHISIMETPKKAWHKFASHLSKQNDARLQLLENKLLLIAQRKMTINQYLPRSFIAAIQGWAFQPSLIDLENMFASQKALAKQMLEVTMSKNVAKRRRRQKATQSPPKLRALEKKDEMQIAEISKSCKTQQSRRRQKATQSPPRLRALEKKDEMQIAVR